MVNEFDINLAREITGRMTAGRIITRDGYTARIICWDALGSLPIVALIDYGRYERAEHFTLEGRKDSRPNVTSNFDLLTEKPRRWLVTYKRANQPVISHELTGYFGLEYVREYYRLEAPDVERYNIEEAKK